MVELLAPAPDEIVLEPACGTGIVGLAAAAALRGHGRVVLSDFSPAVLAVARRGGEELGPEGLERLDAAERPEVRAEIAGRLAPFEAGSGLAFPGVSVVATASAPTGG